MFAGDKSKPAADASYRNLFWENFHVDHSFDIGTKILENKEIGTIDSWGPFFHVSFDLMIHSFRKKKWTSLLTFRHGNGTTCATCGDMFPVLFLHNRRGKILFSNAVFDDYYYDDYYYNDYYDDDYYYDDYYFPIELNYWHNIIIEQKLVDGKVIKLKIKL